MIEIAYGPIKKWPGKLHVAGDRIRAPFKAGYENTMRLLRSELEHAGAEGPMVQLAFRRWRKDGQPFADQQPDHPGVIVSFRKPVTLATGVHKLPLNFPCDTFVDHVHNIRAVALALEALRKIDRYGVTQNAEQYTGFKALPPPGPSVDTILSADDAAKWLAEKIGVLTASEILGTACAYRETYRQLAAKLHPDVNGGRQPTEWAILQACQTFLDEHHNK